MTSFAARVLSLACVALLASPAGVGLSATVQAEPSVPSADASAADAAAVSAPSQISLEPGEIRTLMVDNLTRVALGDPKVADITLVSSNEALLQAKAPGLTNLILWDAQGKHLWDIEVVDHKPEALEAQLRNLVLELGLAGVAVKRENDKVFLTGEVSTQGDLDRLEQMLSAYKGQVTNLASVTVQIGRAHV